MASIIKRKKNYSVVYNYVDENGETKQKWETWHTHKEALKRKAEIENQQHTGTFLPPSNQTITEFLYDFVSLYGEKKWGVSMYDSQTALIANYINPYIGGVTLNQLTPAMVDKMFQQIIDKGLKPSTAAGAKRVLSVALSHARKYCYIETNAAKDTLTKFGKGDKTPDPYTPEQVKALMQRVEGTVWEMPVILGGLYGMRRSEILGLRWRNVDLENNTFDVTEQLPFKVPPKTKVIEEMAPPNPTDESCLSQSLPARSFSNSLLCRKHSANRQKRTESLTMTMTLL